MFYNVYNNKLLIPGKCGSRFVSSFDWSSEERYNFPAVTDTRQFQPHLKYVQWIVLREPHRLLHSAISTEVNSRLTEHARHGYNELTLGVINQIISDVLDKIYSDDGTPHYNKHLYQWMYEFYMSDVKNEKLRFVHLNYLSPLIDIIGVEGGHDYDRHNYDHSKSPYYISMDLLLSISRTDFNDKWLKLFLKMQEQEEYWYKLVNLGSFQNYQSVI